MRHLLIATLLLLPRLGAAADFAAIDAAIASEMKSGSIPGAAVVIVRDGAIVYEKGYGITSADDPRNVTPGTLFRLGSTSKMVTALAAAGLKRQGRLDLDAPVSTYAPQLHRALGRLTMNQLLSHTAGLRDEAPMQGPLDESALGERVSRWDESMLFTEPGEVFSYANPGYVLAGYVIERITGKPFSGAIDDLVLRPTGMSHSSFRLIDAITRPVAVGHDPAGKVIRPFAEHAGNYPPGSLFASAHDMGSLLIALLGGGDDARLISAARASIPALDRSYGYGLELRIDRGVKIAGHTGARAGYGSIVWLIPEEKTGVAILTNRTGAIPFGAARAVAGQFAKTVPSPAVEETSLPIEAAIAGKYVNGTLPVVELVTADGNLTVRVAGKEFAATRVGANRYRAPGAKQLETFLLIGNNGDGSPKYLAAEHWALRRK